MAVDSLDVNEFGSHAQRGVARSQRAGEDGHKARTRWLVHELYEQHTVLHVARAKGRDSHLMGSRQRGTMVAKTDTAEFYIIKYKVTDMYNY